MYFKVKPTPRPDLYDISRANAHVVSVKNFWTNDTWLKMKEIDKFLFPYVMDIFKGKYAKVANSKFNFID